MVIPHAHVLRDHPVAVTVEELVRRIHNHGLADGPRGSCRTPPLGPSHIQGLEPSRTATRHVSPNPIGVGA